MYITGEMILKKLDPFYSYSQNKKKIWGKGIIFGLFQLICVLGQFPFMTSDTASFGYFLGRMQPQNNLHSWK